MDLLKTTGIMPGDLGDFLGTSGYETWTVDPTTWDILGRVPLKNQVLPPDTGKGVLKESGPAKTLFFSELVF